MRWHDQAPRYQVSHEGGYHGGTCCRGTLYTDLLRAFAAPPEKSEIVNKQVRKMKAKFDEGDHGPLSTDISHGPREKNKYTNKQVLDSFCVFLMGFLTWFFLIICTIYSNVQYV